MDKEFDDDEKESNEDIRRIFLIMGKIKKIYQLPLSQVVRMTHEKLATVKIKLNVRLDASGYERRAGRRDAQTYSRPDTLPFHPSTRRK
jgi:hypothetical protein